MKLMSVSKPARVGALLIGVLLAAGFALGAFIHQSRPVRNSVSNDFAIVSKISTPADVRIQTAQEEWSSSIRNQPESYNLLASAFMQRPARLMILDSTPELKPPSVVHLKSRRIIMTRSSCAPSCY